MKRESIPVLQGHFNLKNYDDTYKHFNWQEVEKEFTWSTTNQINIAYEAIDKHVHTFRKNKIALYFDDGNRREKYTFKEMAENSNKAANVLKNFGHVSKGDRVFIFLPRSPEYYFILLGAIKLGAIVGPLFESFMEQALLDRLNDSEAKVLVTTPQLINRVPVDKLPHLQSIFLIGDNITETDLYIDFLKKYSHSSKDCEIEWVGKNDGMLLHYTSGTTGKPKGVLHVHHGMIQLYQTAKWVLDLQEEDVFWCTADPGWITGISYGVFGPWLTGTTNLIVGSHFNPETWYDMIENYGVTIWYSAPTAFRMLMGAGDELVKSYNLRSLRHIFSVGEPLSPEIIHWGMKVFQRRIHDTWWMTETGGQMIANFPCLEIRPGSMGKPFPGIEAAIVDQLGNVLPPYQIGHLALKPGWPAMMKEIWNDEGKYASYFFPNGWYISGDSAYMDEDGYFWFQGRIDDVIITSGERVGPFEVESKLIEHPAVLEAGVIGKPDPVYGEIIKAFVVLRDGFEHTNELKEDICQFVKTKLATHAAPEEIEFIDQLPKTKSGKLIRRILKKKEMDSLKEKKS